MSQEQEAAWRRRHAAFFRRSGLPRRLRHAAALSTLVATGDWIAYHSHLEWAIADRCPAHWLREVMLQSHLFVGYPRAITALRAFHGSLRPEGEAAAAGRDDRFLVEPGGGSLREWRSRGLALCQRIYGHHFRPLLRTMRDTHPDLADWMVTDGYGKVLSRPFLTPRERELCIVPILAAQESWPQLSSHLAGALRAGARRREIEEAIRTAIRMAPDCDGRRARRDWNRIASRR